jgi:hypothetical protein
MGANVVAASHKEQPIVAVEQSCSFWAIAEAHRIRVAAC